MTRKEFLNGVFATAVGVAFCEKLKDKESCMVKKFAFSREPELVDKTYYGSTQWNDKDFYEIVADLNRAVAELKRRNEGEFEPCYDRFEIGISPSCIDSLEKNNKSEYGITVRYYAEHCWPKCNIEVREGMNPSYNGLLVANLPEEGRMERIMKHKGDTSMEAVYFYGC